MDELVQAMSEELKKKLLQNLKPKGGRPPKLSLQATDCVIFFVTHIEVEILAKIRLGRYSFKRSRLPHEEFLAGRVLFV